MWKKYPDLSSPIFQSPVHTYHYQLAREREEAAYGCQRALGTSIAEKGNKWIWRKK